MTVQDSSEHFNTKKRVLILAWIFTAVGVLNCALVSILWIYSLGANQDGVISIIWSFPGIYFIEIFCIGIICSIAMVFNQNQSKLIWIGIPWICSGILFAFVILGAWTFGFSLIPAMILFLLVGAINDKRWQGNRALHLIYFVAAGIAQSFIVFLSL